MCAKVYTKQGDKGQTALVGGLKVRKSDPRIEAYGTIDELNSVLGLGCARMADQSELRALREDLFKIQHWLFDLGSLLATPANDREKFQIPATPLSHVQWMEQKIDEATKELKPLKEFVLPGGSEASGYMHLARTVCRRAERLMTEMTDLPEQTIPFINRLSDYFFVMARFCNHRLGVYDVKWQKSE